MSPILFNLYSECLTKEALDGLGDFNIGGQIIQTVKYEDDLVQGGSNMTWTDLCANKPHCAAAVRP